MMVTMTLNVHTSVSKTEELFFPEFEFGGPPFKSPKIARRYAECSPSSLVSDWTTPCLVIHGGKDFRLGEAEGLSTFTALQRQGIPSELLYFPTENHWVLSPPNSIVCASQLSILPTCIARFMILLT
jgi:dipeptidyl aminopeptidase/acylaminoacyl peptidase